MTKASFPWIALVLCLPIFLLLSGTVAGGPDGTPLLPLLTRLILSEFGGIVTLIGAISGVRAMLEQGLTVRIFAATLACSVLAGWFLWQGVGLWPK